MILLIALLLSVPCWASDGSDELFNFSKKQEEALVVKAVTSTVIVLEDGRRVKLIGVESTDPPPRVYVKRDKDGKVIEEKPEPTISLEEQALTYAQELLENKKVKLEYDVDARSPGGYLFAYVYLPDGTMANTELLKMGFVKLRISPPNIRYEDRLRAAYKQAKKEKRGLEGE